MAAELTCARRTRKIVEENGEQILRKENKKKKKRKALTNLKRPSSIFSPIRSVVNESTAGMLEFRDIVEFRASARLCKIPRSSLTCPQSAPVSSLVAETEISVPDFNLCEIPIEESKVAGC